MENEMDNVCPEKSTPLNPLLPTTDERMDVIVKDIIKSYKAMKEAASNSPIDYIDNPNVPGVSGALYSNENNSDSTKIGSQLLAFRRMICSENLTKSRLTSRNDNVIQNPINRSTVAEQDEEDEAFFEKLKKRISDDIENKNFNGIQQNLSLPKRTSKVKKRKSIFNNESLNLMKKYRTSSNIDNGIFSLVNKQNNENDENIDESKISIEEVEKPSNNVSNYETDSDFRYRTPFLVKETDDQSEI